MNTYLKQALQLELKAKFPVGEVVAIDSKLTKSKTAVIINVDFPFIEVKTSCGVIVLLYENEIKGVK